MAITRRRLLAGAGCGALCLPFLEGLLPRRAAASGISPDSFAIFFRQANGVAAYNEQGTYAAEPERFWPREFGPLTQDNVEGRALAELDGFLDRLLVVGNLNLATFSYADGHAFGALQGLTAQGPVVEGTGSTAEAAGESIDHRIGRELNPGGRDSLFLYAGREGGHLGGPCISYRGPGNRRAAVHDPLLAYQLMMGLDGEQLDAIIARQKSANDYVRQRIDTLTNDAKLSADDRRRLDLHLQAIREVEQDLTCNFAEDQLAILEGLGAGYDSDDGDRVLAAARAHMQVAALAVACGYTRSVAIQVGNGADQSTRYRRLDDGSLMENYHYVSHRRMSHAPSGGDPIPGSDLMHHMVDVQFARTFRFLLEQLEAYELPNAERLIDRGVCAWYNDNALGPSHSGNNVPWVLAGSAGGFFRQGEYVEVDPGELRINHAQLLNTIGSAAGLRKPDGDPIDDFGSPLLHHEPLTELLA